MHRLARRNRTAKFAVETVGLDVGEVTLDVPEPIFAAEAAAFDLARMDRLARLRL